MRRYQTFSVKFAIDMGGIGTWLIGYNNPEIFSRIAPLSGTISRRLKERANEVKFPVWSFVGTEQSDSNAYNSNQHGKTQRGSV